MGVYLCALRSFLPLPFQDAMTRLTARNKRLIADVVRRWAHTIHGTTPETIERVQQILDPVYCQQTHTRRVTRKGRKGQRNQIVWKTFRLKSPKLHVVRSPIAFRIAAACLRGYLSKERAREMCAAYGIDDSFVGPLRRDSLFRSRQERAWFSERGALSNAWSDTLRAPIRGAMDAVFAEREDAGTQAQVVAMRAMRRRQRRGRDGAGTTPEERYRELFSRALADAPPVARDSIVRDLENSSVRMITLANNPWGGRAASEEMTLGNFWQDAKTGRHATETLARIPHSVSEREATHIRMELAGVDSEWGTNYMDAEIFCRGMGLRHPLQTWQHELMHAAPAVMTFRTQALVLLARPTLSRNRDGELHNFEGPAVVYPDGAKAYWLNGHALGALGEKIVERPETLTLEDINGPPNEEIRRCAIEAYGWVRYLEDMNAEILDRRENAVDNTIEALVRVNEAALTPHFDPNAARLVKPHERIARHKLVLACRSTARQYFLSVPNTIHTCEEGQRWLHDGANTAAVDVMNFPVRLLGAS